MFFAIKLSNEILKQYEISKTGNTLIGLGKMNVFIGSNNSGKSRFLRNIIKDGNDLNFFDEIVGENQFNQFIKHFKLGWQNLLSEIDSNGYLFFYSDQFLQLLKLKDNHRIFLEELFLLIYNVKKISKKDFKPKAESTNTNPTLQTINLRRIEKLINNIIGFINEVENNMNNIQSKQKYRKLYIPILRGLRPIQSGGNNSFLNTDAYSERTTYDYFKNSKDFEIYTGLTIYEDIKKLLLGTEEERKTIYEFEEFLRDNIFYESITLIPKHDKDVLHIKVGHNPQLEIYNLGDGLQTIITILFPIFRNRHYQSVVIIEEPEIHLHPEWQMKLLDALKKFENNQYFISTHSSSYINDSDTSIYLVQKTKNISKISYTNLEYEKVEMIKELGYKPSDMFLTNYILWVEGPSDKIYLEYWLNQICPDIKNGKHFTIMFFGGDNYKHYLIDDNDEFVLKFIKNINQSFGIILDSDRKRKGEKYSEKKKKIERIFKLNKSFCWLTQFREIENYIPLIIFKRAVQKVHKKINVEITLSDYDDRNTVIDNDSKPSFKSTIKLPQEIFSTIQKNGDGTTTNISAKLLRKNIENAIQKTQKNTFITNKVNVAKEIVQLKPAIENEELKKMLKKLVLNIKEANNM